jgi:ATP-dependent HslUV protease ATP-binding subunit HslU
MHDLTPRQIVAELDRYIIGQDNAKRAVAVAVRNRWRRQQLPVEQAREVLPKNIIMVGPTGVGKTEIARRLARLVNAPFIKVEASKYTEVGYHGRDVESMIRDLVELAVNMVRAEQAEQVREQAEKAVEDRLVTMLAGDLAPRPVAARVGAEHDDRGVDQDDDASSLRSEIADGDGDVSIDESTSTTSRLRDRLRAKLRDGLFNDREIEITVHEKQTIPVIGMMGPDQFDPAVTSMLENLMPDRTRRRRVTVARARSILMEEETEKLIDREKAVEQAIERSQSGGIIFIDEMDKIASPGSGDGRGGGSGSPDVSRQGVQRDLLPIVEGSAVMTRYGVVHTDGMLFIAAGAFHSASVSDLMPELQGRFPIRVELDPLTKDDFKRILTEPDTALTRQQQALLEAEGLDVRFEPAAIDAMAELAADANSRLENIGARRLMTVMECVFEQISFDAPDMVVRGEKSLTITAEFVRQRLATIMRDEDLSRFVL